MVPKAKLKPVKSKAKPLKNNATTKLKFPQDFLNKIICGDSLTVMRQMPDECLDLVVTSPPYNLLTAFSSTSLLLSLHSVF